MSSLKTNEISLDYLNSRLEYKLVAQYGPIHECVFIIAVKVNGEMYYGLGSSKKKAKNDAAEKVFQVLKNQFQEVPEDSNESNDGNKCSIKRLWIF